MNRKFNPLKRRWIHILQKTYKKKMYWKCNDTKYQIQMITANFWPAIQLTQSSKFWRKKTDLQITPYIYPKKFCIISYNMDMFCHGNTVSYLGFMRGLYSFFSSSTVEHWDRRYSVTSWRRSSKSGDPGKGRRLRQRKQLVKSAPVLCKVSRNDPTKSLKKQNRY